jgi:hypothetical protein
LVWVIPTLLALLAACATNPVSEGPTVGERAAGFQQQMNTVLLYPPLAKRKQYFGSGAVRDGGGSALSVESTGGGQSHGGTMEAWAEVRNRTASAMELQYRARFFDADQRPVESEQAWQRFFMQPDEISTIKALSRTPFDELAYYILEVRVGQ